MRYCRHLHTYFCMSIFICLKEIPSLTFWKKIYSYSLFSCFLPEVVSFPEILKHFIMWFVIFFYKLHLFSDRNVKDTEISILYYWAVSFHHRRRKIHCLPKANSKNSLNVSPIVTEELAGKFVKTKIKISLGELIFFWSLTQNNTGSEQPPCLFTPVLPRKKMSLR